MAKYGKTANPIGEKVNKWDKYFVYNMICADYPLSHGGDNQKWIFYANGDGTFSIASKKDSITSIFFKTQNLIIESCFISEFNNIRNLEDVKEYKNKLYNFKNIMGSNENYTFYNEFYRKIMESLEKKKEQIEQFGEINLFETPENSLVLVDNTKRALSFVSTFFVKVKKLFGFNKSRDTINNLYK